MIIYIHTNELNMYIYIYLRYIYISTQTYTCMFTYRHAYALTLKILTYIASLGNLPDMHIFWLYGCVSTPRMRWHSSVVAGIWTSSVPVALFSSGLWAVWVLDYDGEMIFPMFCTDFLVCVSWGLITEAISLVCEWISCMVFLIRRDDEQSSLGEAWSKSFEAPRMMMP